MLESCEVRQSAGTVSSDGEPGFSALSLGVLYVCTHLHSRIDLSISI